MRFLADEGCDACAARALRRAGYDVLDVGEVRPRAEDADVIRLALRSKRILLTEDKDFGQLVYAHGRQSVGVVLIRYPAPYRRTLAKDVVSLVKRFGRKLDGSFTVLQPGRTRIRRALKE
jgi:predicted nuclease of predicted toxin-antitoxin system